MAMNVSGKTALITGAGSGINFSYAKLLLSKGCNVLIADLSLRPEAEELLTKYPLSPSPPTSSDPATTAEPSTSSGPVAKAVFQKTDVADWKQLDKMFEVAIQHFGSIDIVCPGAGIYEPLWSNFWHAPGTELSKDDPTSSRFALVDINITHPIRVTQMAIAHFLSHKKSGTVVHVTSIGGQCPYFPTPIYVASKHAINGLVRSLASLENPPSHIPKIRINAVAPARILTPLWTENPEKMKMVGKEGNWVMPEEVAQVMVDLVERSEYVGGSIVEIGANVRLVSAFDDAGPQGHGNGLTHDENYDEEIWRSMEGLMG